MKLRNTIFLILGILLGIIYIFIASSLKNTSAIWLLTRGFGLFAYTFLFFLIAIGELKLLGFKSLFRWHCTLGIAVFSIALLHGVSAVFEKFKFGKSLHFIDYLGFNFSSKWLTLLSLGTLAFYLIFILSITSSHKSIQSFGFKRWKIIHYLSYIAFTLVFIHSIILGTDLKTSSIRVFVFPIANLMFYLAISLLILRIVRKFIPERKDIIFLIILLALIAVSITIFTNSLRVSKENSSNNTLVKEQLLYDQTNLTDRNAYLKTFLNFQSSNIDSLRKSSDMIETQIIDKINATINTPVIINDTPKIVYIPVVHYVYEPVISDTTYTPVDNERDEEDD